MRATAKPKRCLAPLDEVATHVRRRESIGVTAQANPTADDGEADDGSMGTTARADLSDGEAEAPPTPMRATAKPKRCLTAQADATADDGEADDGSMRTTARADESDGVAEALLTPIRATAKPKRCLTPLDEVATHVRRRQSTWSDGASQCDWRRRRSRRWQYEHSGKCR